MSTPESYINSYRVKMPNFEILPVKPQILTEGMADTD
jgi:hypothetical protein